MIFVIDGTFDGLLCAIFESFDRKIIAQEIQIESTFQPSIFDESYTIETIDNHANRVEEGLKKLIGINNTKLLYTVFLSEKLSVWNAMYRIIIRLFRGEKNLLENFGDSDVLEFTKTLKMVSRERHRMKAFIRFSKTQDGTYFALISPDFNVLPLIITFFKNRYADQNWIIYDESRDYGIYYLNQQILEINLLPKEKEALIQQKTNNTLDNSELLFQKLWKKYFESTNIKERKNTKLHLQYVPKRYWKYLTEKL